MLFGYRRCRQKFLLNKKYFPDWNCFCLLKLIAVLFPTSDYSHPVVSPAFLFGTEILDSSRVQSVPDLTKGLMLCGILCDYVAESKLFIPGVNGFLQSAIWSLDSDVVDIKKRPCPTFLTSSLLSPNGKVTQQQIAQISISDVFGGRQTTEIMAEKLKISCTSMAVQLCLKFADMWKDLQSYEEIFKNITESCTRLNKDFYPESLRNDIDQLVIRLTANRAMVKRVPMRFESARIAGTKPQKEFKFLEPRIEANFNPEKSRRGGGKKGAAAERQRLVHVYKRELKGTVRELKRDSQFIARAELMEEKSRDERRKRKTKELMKSLMGQEGEYKKFKRMKSKK